MDSFQAAAGGVPEMTCSADVVSTSHMSLMSVESFLKISTEDLKGKFMKCIESSETAYSFRTGSLPAQVQRAQACRLISKLMHADVVLGPY